MMKAGTYVDKGVEVVVTENTITITGLSSNQLRLTEHAGTQLLGVWQDAMKARGNFLYIVGGVCFRSGEVRSVVRCLRQAS